MKRDRTFRSPEDAQAGAERVRRDPDRDLDLDGR